MLIRTDCIPCILDDLNGALELIAVSEDQRFKAMIESLKFLLDNIGSKKVPSSYITEVHRIAKRVTGVDKPFLERRRSCNELGVALANSLDLELSNLDGYDKFRALIGWAIAGNVLDFRTVGTGYKFDVETVKNELISLAEKIDVDMSKKILDLFMLSKRILFVHDNVGEIALDKLLIKEMKRFQGVKVTSAVRGGPITSDVTMEDALQVGLADISDSIIVACPDTLGVSFDEMTPEFKKQLETSDLIISKGQANFYVFSEYKDTLEAPVVCLLRTKCRVVSKLFGYDENINIATVL